MKKTVAVILAFVMIFSCANVAFAAEEPTDNETETITDFGSIQWIVDLPFWPADNIFSGFTYPFFAMLVNVCKFLKIVDSKTAEAAKEIMKIGYSNYYYNRLYDQTVKDFAEENKLYDDFEIDVVFLGDSLTAGYDVKNYYPEYLVVNRGIGGDKTFTLKKRLEVSVFELKPKVCVMLIGGNNIDTMFDDYEDILISFKEEIPETKIVLVSHTPTSDPFAERNETLVKNNGIIKSLAEKYGYEFVDIYTPLFDNETGKMKSEYTTDGAHLTKEGYEVFNGAIKPVVDRLLNFQKDIRCQ